MQGNFCAFILTHGRPDNVKTYQAIRSRGYTGMIRLIVDDTDKTLPEYQKKYPGEVMVFSKAEIAKTFDSYDTSTDMRTIIYARNYCFEAARLLGVSSFIQLDDDYTSFLTRSESCGIDARDMDRVLSALTLFLKIVPSVSSVAFSQGGDHMGGFDPTVSSRRKAMNSFVCLTDRPFQFVGRINEDVNTYTTLGRTGTIFLTIPYIQVNQVQTQKAAGGMTGVYVGGGTYVKSFYSVMGSPSSVKIKTVGNNFPRLHHGISWEHTVPKIIEEKWKKP